MSNVEFRTMKGPSMHHNTVKGKWKLAHDYTKHRHSSAAFYELGVKGIDELVHYKDLGR